MKRSNTIDCCKGFAIILVVFGHLLQRQNPITPDHNLLFRIIYSFHMGLFFFLAGQVFKKRPLSKEIILNFKRLIVPFFCFFFIVTCSLNIDVFIGRFCEYILNPQIGFWFLFVLATIRLIASFILQNKLISTFFFLITLFFLEFFLKKLFALDYILFYIPIFLIGFFSVNYSSHLTNKIKKIALMSDIEGWIFLFFLLIAYIYFFKFYSRNLEGVSMIFFLTQKYILAILGISISLKFFQMFDFENLYRFFSYIGKYTLCIYGLHFLFADFYLYVGYLAIMPMLFFPIFTQDVYSYLMTRFK